MSFKSNGFTVMDGDHVVASIAIDKVVVYVCHCPINITNATVVPPVHRIEVAAKMVREALVWYANRGTVQQKYYAQGWEDQNPPIVSTCMTALELWDELR